MRVGAVIFDFTSKNFYNMRYKNAAVQNMISYKGAKKTNGDTFACGIKNTVEGEGVRNEQILAEITEDFKRLKEVEAVVLGGSSAAKTADSKSDFDIYVYCSKIPSVQSRRALAEKYSMNPEINNQYFETGDEFKITETGKPVDIMYRSIEDMEAHVQRVWVGGEAQMGYTTCFVDNINKSKILYDRDGRFKELQKKTCGEYPKALQDNIIRKNFTFLKDASSSYHKQISSAIERGDLVSVNHRSAAFLASYFDVIFAKNCVMHPGEKRLVNFALNNCKILPENFEQYVNTVATGPVEMRAEIAARMVENLRKIL